MKNLTQILLAILLGILLMGATCTDVQPPPIILEPTDTANCASACARLSELGCPEGEPLEDGTTCTMFCEETQKQGHPLNPTCVMDMTSCTQLNECSAPRE